jgi:hypothetical protein
MSSQSQLQTCAVQFMPRDVGVLLRRAWLWHVQDIENVTILFHWSVAARNITADAYHSAINNRLPATSVRDVWCTSSAQGCPRVADKLSSQTPNVEFYHRKLWCRATSTVTLLLLALWPFSAAAKLSLGDKAPLQSVMDQHVEKNLVSGAFLHLDPVSGGGRSLYPDAAHPMIFSMDKYCVLCLTFRDSDEKVVNVDFYLAPHKRSYLVRAD